MSHTPQERFAAKVEAGEGGCTVFTGARDSNGYGTFKDDGRMHKAHRWSWEREFGAVPVGCELHHTCKNRACVNLEHLQLVTPRQHAHLEGRTFSPQAIEKGAAFQRDKTSCPQGHPYEGDNLYVSPGGKRHCRACNTDRRRDRQTAEPDSLSVPQVAVKVGVHPNSVRAAIRDGDLEAWRPRPTILRIQPEAVQAWMSRMSNTKPKGTTAARLRAVE